MAYRITLAHPDLSKRVLQVFETGDWNTDTLVTLFDFNTIVPFAIYKNSRPSLSARPFSRIDTMSLIEQCLTGRTSVVGWEHPLTKDSAMILEQWKKPRSPLDSLEYTKDASRRLSFSTCIAARTWWSIPRSRCRRTALRPTLAASELGRSCSWLNFARRIPREAIYQFQSPSMNLQNIVRSIGLLYFVICDRARLVF